MLTIFKIPFPFAYILLVYNKDFCRVVSYRSAKRQLKFIISIVQLLMLNQLIIDKDIHSFILCETVIFIGFYSAQLIVVFLPSRLFSILLPVSGPPDVSS